MRLTKIVEVRTATGEVVSVDEAKSGEPLFCIYCGTGMYKNSSVLGKPYFATLPGHVHTAPECEMISMQTESAKRRYAIEKTNPIIFLRSLLKEPIHTQQTRGGNIPQHGPEGIVPEKLRPFRSLGELHESGICYCWPGTRLGNGCVGDCCACVDPLIANIIDDPMYKGECIFYAGVDDIRGDDFSRFCELIRKGNPRIAFPIFSRYQAQTYRRKYLILECRYRELLDTIIEALYDRSLDDYGRTMYKAKCKNILIAGDWNHGSCIDCPHTCSSERRPDCQGALIATYVSSKQIYGIVSKEPKGEPFDTKEIDNNFVDHAEPACCEEL